mgnify:CR=1 FL=1
MRLWDYSPISIFSPDLSSTVKWSSQTMMRSSQRFTRVSSKASKCAGCCLMKSCSSLMRAICASLAAVSTVHFSRCSRSLKISSAIQIVDIRLKYPFTKHINERCMKIIIMNLSKRGLRRVIVSGHFQAIALPTLH